MCIKELSVRQPNAKLLTGALSTLMLVSLVSACSGLTETSTDRPQLSEVAPSYQLSPTDPPRDGEFVNYKGTVYLWWRDGAVGVPSWETLVEITGGIPHFRSVNSIPKARFNITLPDKRFAPWLKPVVAIEHEGRILAVVGGVAHAFQRWETFVRHFGYDGYKTVVKVDEATLKRFPRGEDVEVILGNGGRIRSPGSIIISEKGGEVRIVQGINRSAGVESMPILWGYCKRFAVALTSEELRRYQTQVLLPPNPSGGCHSPPPPLVILPDFVMPLEGGYRWSVTGGPGAYATHTGISYFSVDFDDVADGKSRSHVPVLASGRGKILLIDATSQTGYGVNVLIDHGWGITVRYAHLASVEPNLKRGEEVRAGQRLGILGKTGKTTGTHLHWEARYNNEGYSQRTILSQLIIDGLPVGAYVGGTTHLSKNF